MKIQPKHNRATCFASIGTCALFFLDIVLLNSASFSNSILCVCWGWEGGGGCINVLLQMAHCCSLPFLFTMFASYCVSLL